MDYMDLDDCGPRKAVKLNHTLTWTWQILDMFELWKKIPETLFGLNSSRFLMYAAAFIKSALNLFPVKASCGVYIFLFEIGNATLRLMDG